MRNLLFIATIFLFCQPVLAQQTANSINDEEVIRRVADKIIQEAVFEFQGVGNDKTYKTSAEVPDTAKVRLKSGYASWGYTNGVLNMAMLNLGAHLKDEKYTNYTQRQLAFAFDNYKVFETRYLKAAAGNPNPSLQLRRSFPFNSLFIIKELDDCGAMGASLLDTYQLVKREDYLAHINRTANHITSIQERFKDGTLSRKAPYPLTLWADDLYMSVPFLARMGKFTGDKKYYDDAIKQVLNFSKYLWDNEKELNYHAYFNDTNRRGVAYWGRCNGWIMVAQIHLLNNLP